MSQTLAGVAKPLCGPALIADASHLILVTEIQASSLSWFSSCSLWGSISIDLDGMSLTAVARSEMEISNFEFEILILELSISELSWVSVGSRLKEVHTLSAVKFVEKCQKQCEKADPKLHILKETR